jgi:peptidoglycan hydrolase-like protein with peptidoglycan-binding domain
MKQEGKFILLTRDEFKQWLDKQNIKRTIKTIQQHHTYAPSYKSFKNNHFELVKNMEGYHIRVGKMSEIAQNITIFPDGLIMICRTFEKDPAGVYGANTNAICIENVGNFDINGDVMSEEHKKSIIFVNACLGIKFKLEINTNTILYHSWFKLKSGGYKSCCGTNWFGGNTKESAEMNFYPLIRNEVNKIMNPEIQYPIIKVGSKGEYVTILQNKLKELGYTITVDGDFGKGTYTIIKQFQKMYNLTQDGIVGKNTWKILMSTEKLPISIVEETKNYEIEYMNNYINIVKIPKDKLKKIDVILCKQPKETLSSVYNRLNPKPSFILNGGLFAMNNGNSMSSMWDEGKKIVEGYFSDYGLYVKNDGSFGFGNHKQLTDIKDFIGASPSIIIDGKINIDLKGLTKDKAFTDSRHPRTCLGMDDKYLYLILVDGRQTGKVGMTINELANLGIKLGLKYFINLDGGGSSRLLGLNAKVINSPTENRAIDNCIAFYI